MTVYRDQLLPDYNVLWDIGVFGVLATAAGAHCASASRAVSIDVKSYSVVSRYEKKNLPERTVLFWEQVTMSRVDWSVLRLIIHVPLTIDCRFWSNKEVHNPANGTG